MMMRLRRIDLALPWALLLVCASAAGTTLARMSIGQMAHIATIIVRARCVKNSAAWDAGEIWTFTTFEIEETWKGTPHDAQIVVRLLGGNFEGLTSSVPGVPRFVEGEKVILFLEPNARGDLSVVSWMQGTFRVRRDQMSGNDLVTQDTAAFATFNPRTRRFQASGIHGVPIDSFRAAVAAALRGNTGEKP